MSYFNPKVYNRENLTDADRRELDYWHDVFMSTIDGALCSYVENDEDCEALYELKKSIVEHFCEELKLDFGCAMQEHAVSVIDDYEHDVPEHETYTTYYYDNEEEDDKNAGTNGVRI